MDRKKLDYLSLITFLVSIMLLYTIKNVQGFGYFEAFTLMLIMSITTPLAGEALLSKSKPLSIHNYIIYLAIGIYFEAFSIVLMVYYSTLWKLVATFLYILLFLIVLLVQVYRRM